MACVDHIESRRQWVPLTAQPFQMIAAGMALGWVVAMAADVPPVEPVETWHGNVRVMTPALSAPAE